MSRQPESVGRAVAPSHCEQDASAIVEQYLLDLEAGKQPDRQALLEAHSELRAELIECLDALDFVHQVAPQLADSMAGNGGGDGGPGRQRLKPSANLGDFRIVRELGRGGMGVVYEAEQLSMGRTVALKVLPFAAVMDEKAITRFKNEARAAGTLHHPNIVPVHAVGNERGVYYYAMALIEGLTLCQVITELRQRVLSGQQPAEGSEFRLDAVAAGQASWRQALASGSDGDDVTLEAAGSGAPREGSDAEHPTVRDLQAALSTHRTCFDRGFFQQVARLGIQAGEALHHAHEHGIVHRDIKPGNLMIDPSGKLWVTDFGLARMESDAGMTMTGDLVGTLRYMAPEQALAKRIVVDHRADIYSLGVTLYELLTLRPVFDGADREALLKQLAFEEPKPIRQLNPHVPVDLATVVTKAIAKNPDERYASSQEMADDLRAVLEDRPITARPPTLLQRAGKWSARHKPLVASAAAAIVLVTIALAISNVVVSRERNQKQQALDEVTQVLGEKDEALGLAEANLRLAMQAVDEVYLQSIGEQRLLRISDAAMFPTDQTLLRAQRGLTDQDRELARRGIQLYGQIANQNPSSMEAKFESAKARSRLALLQATLDEQDTARATYQDAIASLEELTVLDPQRADYFLELGRACYQLGLASRWWPESTDTFAPAEAAARQAVALDADNADALRLYGKALIALSRYEDAVPSFEKLVELKPDDAAAHHDLGRLFWHMYEDRQALIHAKRAVELEPNGRVGNESYRHHLAQIYQYRLEDAEAAAALYEADLPFANSSRQEYEIRIKIAVLLGQHRKVVELTTRQLEQREGFGDYLRRATARRQLGETELALEDLNSAVPLAGTRNAWNFIEIANEYQALGRPEDALSPAERAVALAPNNHRAQELHGSILYALEEYEQASQAYEHSVNLAPHVSYLYARLARACVRAGNNERWERVLALCDEAIKSDPDNPRHYANHGSLYIGLEKWQEAVASFSEVLRRQPGPELAQHARNERGFSYQQLGDLEKAIGDHTWNIELNQKHANAYGNRAECYFELGAWEKAIADFTKEIELQAHEPSDFYERAYCYMRLGQWENAVEDWTRTIERLPANANAYGNRAYCNAQLEDWEQARADLDKAIELSSENAYLWYTQAMLALKLDDLEDYRQVCADMLAQFAEVSDPQQALWIVWTCSLKPDAVDDLNTVRALAETHFSQASPESQPELDNALGATLYRCDEYDQAIKLLESLDAVWGEDPDVVTLSRAYTWYFLAMAYQHRGQQGDEEEAARWLRKANAWAERELAERPKGEPAVSFNRALTLKLLRDEAESIVLNAARAEPEAS